MAVGDVERMVEGLEKFDGVKDVWLGCRRARAVISKPSQLRLDRRFCNVTSKCKVPLSKMRRRWLDESKESQSSTQKAGLIEREDRFTVDRQGSK